jgi:hypothetical protein
MNEYVSYQSAFFSLLTRCYRYAPLFMKIDSTESNDSVILCCFKVYNCHETSSRRVPVRRNNWRREGPTLAKTIEKPKALSRGAKHRGEESGDGA